MRGVYVVVHTPSITTATLTHRPPQAHAHIATLHYLSTASSQPPHLASLALALKHFCRAVELNDSYLRGYYGIKLLVRVLLPLLSSSSTNSSSSSKRSQDTDDDNNVPIPSLSTVQKLDELATTQLAAMVRDFTARKKGASGYDEAEIAAARELLGREGAAPR